MWRHLLLEKEDFNQKVIGLLTDKSVKFEKAVLLLSLKEEMSKAAIEAADLIGKISWLTDDLCDFISDIREQRKIHSYILKCRMKRWILNIERKWHWNI